MPTKYVASTFLLVSCAGGPAVHNEDALAAERLEIALDSNGRATEIEYHIRPEAVPEAVHRAMEALYPGARAIAAEKEYEGSDAYWELTVEQGGFDVEAMFRPDGTLHSMEVQVAVSKVPAAVQATIKNAGYGTVRAWEEIYDGDKALREYHVKTTRDGRHYKILVGTDGTLRRVFRELEAELEIPVD